MSELLDCTIQTARKTASELRPGVLDDLGLVAALEWEIVRFEERTGIKCTFVSPADDIQLGRQASTALFRICQELLTNVATHANAKATKVLLKEQDGQIFLDVSDNGRGITQKEVSSSKSLGILGMRERALSLGGAFNISGARRKGTKAIVRIPQHTPNRMKGE